ncbi:MAG: homoserine dehydrogenase [Lachnospiraceae bacterium]|nr:homoserine dehydrogenase [Lachnospiraceae bacterium]
MINIAVLGYGTVGSGVVEVITRNRDIVNKRAGNEINIKYVLDLRDFPGDPVQEILVHDYNIILNDPEVEIVVEVMGGINPAYGFVKSALEAGKSVATSNKELVAAHGAELLEVAKANKVNFIFEASVGGGIPIIRPINQSLTADNITEITGILNGTTNYILTKMFDEGLPFDTVLKTAQDMGYAERNPEADIEGYDACRKIAILTSLVCGKQVDYQDIHTEGITKITDVDIKYAKAMGCTIKLFGTSLMEDGKIYSMVAPFVVGNGHILENVNDVFNGIFIKGNMLGDTMFYGKGAGKLPTASAVVSDVVDAAKHMGKNIMTIWEDEKLAVSDVTDYECRFFARLSGSVDKAAVEASFGKVDFVSVEGVDEVAFITEKMSEKCFNDKVADFELIYRIRTTL